MARSLEYPVDCTLPKSLEVRHVIRCVRAGPVHSFLIGPRAHTHTTVVFASESLLHAIEATPFVPRMFRLHAIKTTPFLPRIFTKPLDISDKGDRFLRKTAGSIGPSLHMLHGVQPGRTHKCLLWCDLVPVLVLVDLDCLGHACQAWILVQPSR